MPEKIKVTFLGTSDSVPSAARNHPAILLTYQGENILIDCGEGTQRQFRKAKLNPCKVNRILITHWHADHVLGIPGMIKTLTLSGYKKTLYIYGPKGTKSFMTILLNLFAFRHEYPIKVLEVEGKFFETKDFYLEAEKMSHRIPCNAYSFVKKGNLRIDKKKLQKLKIPSGSHLQKLKQGKNIVYKGKKYLAKNLTYKQGEKKISVVLDTSFNKKITPFVKNSDIFICESTFMSPLTKIAEERHHLTVKQVAEIAKKSGTKKLFLMHISQRYSKELKKILAEAKKTFKNSHISKDLDQIEL
ncbi:MAG TPA: ribonuclease Z [Bacillota bacterium]|nr:ribonuclease Z [Bacillota bacterium]